MAPKTSDMWGAGASIFLAAAQVKCQYEHSKSWGIAEFYGNLLEDPIALKPLYEKIYPVAASLIEIDPATGALSKTTVSFLLTFRRQFCATYDRLPKTGETFHPKDSSPSLNGWRAPMRRIPRWSCYSARENTRKCRPPGLVPSSIPSRGTSMTPPSRTHKIGGFSSPLRNWRRLAN